MPGPRTVLPATDLPLRAAAVWIVEDSPAQAQQLVRSLPSLCIARVFGEGHAMLEALALGDAPALILLDWHLPDSSGLEVLQAVRATHDAARLPVLMVTMNDARDDRLAGLAAGANDYVIKPYDIAELRARTRGLLHATQLHADLATARGSLETERNYHRDASLVFETLTRIGALLTRDLDPDALARRLLDEATAATRAEAGAFLDVEAGRRDSTLGGEPFDLSVGLPMARDPLLISQVFAHAGATRIGDFPSARPRAVDGPAPMRSVLGAPLIARGGTVLGALFLGHREPDAFTPADAELLAAIVSIAASAFENARLYAQARQAEHAQTRRANEAMLQAAIGSAIGEVHSVRTTLQTCADALVQHLGVALARIWTADLEGTTLELQASAGLYTHLEGLHETVSPGQSGIGRIALERTAYVSQDVESDPRMHDRAWAMREGLTAFAGFPLVARGQLLGVLAVFSRNVLGDDVVAALGSTTRLIGPGLERERLHVRERAARAEAEAQRANLQAVIEQAPAPFLVLRGPRFLIEVANPAVLRSWGRTLDILGRPLLEALPEIVGQGFDTLLANVLATGEPAFGRETHARVARDGVLEDIYYTFAYVPMRDADGTVSGVIVLAPDVTEQVRDRQRAEAARARAEEADRAKDDFLATVSHELRTPLNAMLGWTKMLRAGMLTGSKRERALETIERSAMAQASLVDDLLDVSRILSGKLRLQLAWVDLAALVEASAESMRPAADARGLALQTSIGPCAPVQGDVARLGQILANLLTNAVKFTPRGGWVRITVATRETSVEVSVEDNGQGMDPSFVPHVFERFRQAEGGLARSHGGLGLGLSIVKHLVEGHGGTITADSAGPGRGSRFTFGLPRAADAQPVVGTASHVGGLDADTFERPAEIDGLNVLVCDDEPDARELIASILGECHARVTTAASVAEVFARLPALRPDVIVSDLSMPGETGYDLIRRLRALPPEQGGRTPAVALTALARSEDRTRALRAGFSMYISKPVEPQELIAVVANLVDRVRSS